MPAIQITIDIVCRNPTTVSRGCCDESIPSNESQAGKTNCSCDDCGAETKMEGPTLDPSTILSIKMRVESDCSSTETQSEVSIRDLCGDHRSVETHRSRASFRCCCRGAQHELATTTATREGRVPTTPSSEFTEENFQKNDVDESKQPLCIQRGGMYSNKKDLFGSDMLQNLGLDSGGRTIQANVDLEL